LVEEIKNPNSELIEEKIIGPTFIKPKAKYQYKFNDELQGSVNWKIDNKIPVKIDKIDDTTIEIVWQASFSG
jgi:hypothetical protein